MLTSAILGILSLVILIAVGFVLCGKEWFAAHGPELFPKFVISTTIPCYMFSTVYIVCNDREQLIEIIKLIPIPIATISVMIALSMLICRLMKIRPGERGVFVCAIAFCNTVLVGMPVIEAIFGREALADATIYFLANMTLFWTVGGILLKRDAGLKPKIFSLQTVKSFFSPAIMGAIIAGVAIFIGLKIPDFIIKPIDMLGKCSTPLAMIFTGCVIRRANIKKLAFSRKVLSIFIARFMLSPAFMLGVCLLLPMPQRMERVFFAYSIMPAMTQLSILAKVYGSDYEFASLIVSLTTICSVLIIPIYVGLIGILGI